LIWQVFFFIVMSPLRGLIWQVFFFYSYVTPPGLDMAGIFFL
jgi:hypothetical protein